MHKRKIIKVVKIIITQSMQLLCFAQQFPQTIFQSPIVPVSEENTAPIL